MLRLGIDVGDTNTDAVLVDESRVVAAASVATTPDINGGILRAITGLRTGPGFEHSQVAAVMIGTTHFSNALAEGNDLAQTAAIRFGLPATSAFPPLVDCPEGLRRAIGGHGSPCHGGTE